MLMTGKGLVWVMRTAQECSEQRIRMVWSGKARTGMGAAQEDKWLSSTDALQSLMAACGGCLDSESERKLFEPQIPEL